MMKKVIVATSLLFATSPIAAAQEMAKITYSGTLSAERLSGSTYAENFFYGNGDINFRWKAGSDLNFGADIGIESYSVLRNDSSNYNATAYYASVVLEGSLGKVSIGMPRGVTSDYFSVPAIAGSELSNLELAFLGTDFFRFLKLEAAKEGIDVYGVRFDGEINRVNFATSLSKISNSSSNIIESVAQYNGGQWSFTLGTSAFDLDGASTNTISLEFQGNIGSLSGGVAYNRSDVLVSSVDITRAFAAYQVNDALKVNAQVMKIESIDIDNSNGLVYSIDLSYVHNSGAFINAGMFTGDIPDDEVFNVALGYKF